MDTDRHPTTGHHPGQHNGPAAGSHAEIGRLLAHLEQRVAELDRLHHEIAEDAQALAHAAVATRRIAAVPGPAPCTRSALPQPSWG